MIAVADGQEIPGLAQIRFGFQSDEVAELDPGDLSKLLPPEGSASVSSPLAAQFPSPLALTPEGSAVGGVVFFHNNVSHDDFIAMLRVLGINQNWGNGDSHSDFAAFSSYSEVPWDSGFIRQLRLVDSLALMGYPFWALSGPLLKSFPKQALSLPEALWTFVEHQRREWGTFYGDSPKLQELFPDRWTVGNPVELSFGLLVEGNHGTIVRIWSRAWVVHK